MYTDDRVRMACSEAMDDPKLAVDDLVEATFKDRKYRAKVIGPSFQYNNNHGVPCILYPIEIFGNGFWQDNMEITRICVLAKFLRKV